MRARPLTCTRTVTTLAPCHPRHNCTPFTSGSKLYKANYGDARAARLKTAAKQSTVSNSLISVLKDELKWERESYRKDERLLEPPPNGFTLADPPGRSTFFLGKDFKGEAILVECDIESQDKDEDEEAYEEDTEDPDDDDDDGEASTEDRPVSFEVTIEKAGKRMLAACEAAGDLFSITHLALLSDSEDSEDAAEDAEAAKRYTGPVFDELDETLQQAFLDFFDERGINVQLGNYLRLVAIDKMALEYQTWLQKVRDFVAS